jgi:hypothetical protein
MSAPWRHHEGLDPFAPLAVVYAHHRDLRHLRVGLDRCLHLGRVDVDAAGDDHVPLATLDEEAAVAIPAGEVPDAEEAVAHARSRRLVVVVVARHEHLVARVELAHLSDADLAAAVVEQPHLVAREHLADGPRGRAQVVGLCHRHERQLRRAVAVEEYVAEVIHDLRA